MPTDDPSAVIESFVAALNAGDLDAVMALYASDATLALDGRELKGAEAIRKHWATTLRMEPSLTMKTERVVQGPETALHVDTWELTATLADGSTLQAQGQGIEVLQRQPDGSWRCVLDFPGTG